MTNDYFASECYWNDWPEAIRVGHSETAGMREWRWYEPARDSCFNVSGSNITFECSHCGARYIPAQIVEGDEKQEWHYCPRCGSVIEE